MRDGDVVRWSPNIPLSIVENQVFDVHELAGDPHAGGGVMEVCPLDEPRSDWAAPYNFIEARQLILGVSDRRKKGRQRQITYFIGHCYISVNCLILKLS
ncbi:hypothetical protein GCM10007920_32330 [Ciceribacter naphthalenivorans]|uniref:Uncharacterized protein n=2 Tax=Alphaproteobacteria TaxID=28211 RepID=A0A512HKF8_9HYPH|nr:hypothetical protein RNA01_28670 [Ciceribacter naphthalenivorans]GLR23442.1 hypothetical protein GCM10007920_32330 [Ciceribacter naphthalenivorans]GLT06298.1 hypothetical protein GCM10007926_32330 [Sphingomonas psychrolutea]